MTKSIKEIIDSLTHEEFMDLVESIPPEELAHYGVLGMKWGVRKDRRTGKRVGKPAAGTKRAKHSTPSVSPKPQLGAQKKETVRKTASPSGETSVPTSKKGNRVAVKLDQKQKSKLGAQGLELEDLSVDQLRTVADRMRLESEITKMLDGPTKDQAMQAVVNRIKLEQEYARLTAAPPSKKQIVLKKTGQILASVAETQAKNVLNAVAKSKIDAFLIQNGIQPTKNQEKKKNTQDEAPKGWTAPKNWKPPKPKNRKD